MCDLMNAEVFREKLKKNLGEKKIKFLKIFTVKRGFDFEQIFETYREYAERLRPYVTDYFCSALQFSKGR